MSSARPQPSSTSTNGAKMRVTTRSSAGRVERTHGREPAAHHGTSGNDGSSARRASPSHAASAPSASAAFSVRQRRRAAASPSTTIGLQRVAERGRDRDSRHRSRSRCGRRGGRSCRRARTSWAVDGVPSSASASVSAARRQRDAPAVGLAATRRRPSHGFLGGAHARFVRELAGRSPVAAPTSARNAGGALDVGHGHACGLDRCASSASTSSSSVARRAGDRASIV